MQLDGLGVPVNKKSGLHVLANVCDCKLSANEDEEYLEYRRLACYQLGNAGALLENCAHAQSQSLFWWKRGAQIRLNTDTST